MDFRTGDKAVIANETVKRRVSLSSDSHFRPIGAATATAKADKRSDCAGEDALWRRCKLAVIALDSRRPGAPAHIDGPNGRTSHL